MGKGEKMLPVKERLEMFEKWVEALRSGEYKQTTEVLRSREGDCYCCLGVLCNLIDPTTWDRPFFYAGWSWNNEPGEGLPELVAELYGIEEGPATVPSGEKITIRDISDDSLAGLNDSGATFAEIADVIEAEFIEPLRKELAATS
jgi:hypothetical protein